MSKWQEGIDKHVAEQRQRIRAEHAINDSDAALKELHFLRQTNISALVRTALMYPNMLVTSVDPVAQGSGWAVRIEPTSGIRKGVAQ